VANPGSRRHAALRHLLHLPTENTEVIDAFLARTPGARELDLATEAGLRQPHGRQLLAQEGGHDGFYYAKLIKIAAARG
jgi:16S rRNA (cytosine967-C5)-methyltransferase